MRDERGILLTDFTLTYQVPRMSSSSDMRDYILCTFRNFTKIELIIDHVHESREIS